MAECLDCLDGLSLEDILKLVTTCDESGNVSWNLYEVTDTTDCHSCVEYRSIVDLVRRSLYCESGVYYLRVNFSDGRTETECLDCLDGLSLDDIINLVVTCDVDGNVSWNLHEVLDANSCFICTEFDSIIDLFRKSLYCEDGIFYIRVSLSIVPENAIVTINGDYLVQSLGGDYVLAV